MKGIKTYNGNPAFVSHFDALESIDLLKGIKTPHTLEIASMNGLVGIY